MIESWDPSKLQWSLPCQLIVKSNYYSTRDWNEGKTMLLVAERTTLPVPKVFAIISTGADQPSPAGKRYEIQIVMQKVPGEDLDVLWDRSNEKQKQILQEQIGKELREYLEQLSQIKHDDGKNYIRAVDGGPVKDTKFIPAPDRGECSLHDFEASRI